MKISPHPSVAAKFAAYAAWMDIRNDFARTYLGTLWQALVLAVLTLVLGIFFSAVFKVQSGAVETYFPYLAAGLVVWSYLTGTINRSAAAYVSEVQALRHQSRPYESVPLRIFFKHTVVFLQNIVIAVVAFAIWAETIPDVPWLAVGLVVLGANVYWLSVVTGVACIRFRDLPQLLSTLLHLVFFLTPIIWRDFSLGRFLYLLDFNPFFHLVEIVRAPLLGHPPGTVNLVFGAALAVWGLLFAQYLVARTRRAIPYWL